MQLIFLRYVHMSKTLELGYSHIVVVGNGRDDEQNKIHKTVNTTITNKKLQQRAGCSLLSTV